MRINFIPHIQSNDINCDLEFFVKFDLKLNDDKQVMILHYIHTDILCLIL